MSYRYSPEMLLGPEPEPAGWSTEAFKSARLALAAGRARYGADAPIWTAWVVEQSYAAQLPPATQLLADLKERAAELGADTSCFDALAEGDVAVLERMLRQTLTNWETWLVSGNASKRSTVVVVENRERHAPSGNGSEK
jgi:hypothetical protein